MIKSLGLPGVFISIIICLPFLISAQVPDDKDTFFLARKKGILGRIGRVLSTDGPTLIPTRTVNPFLKFAGKKIASIEVSSFGLSRNLEDTSNFKKTFITNIADALHKNTSDEVIRNHLFFEEGDRVLPLLFSDNERFLREQAFLQNARIIIIKNLEDSNQVDVLVATRDVFSIGGSVNFSSFNKSEVEVREENLGGSGMRVALFGLYDKERKPNGAFGGEVVRRNIKGTFLNWKVGFKTFNNSYSSQRKEETRFYSSIERPLVSRYTQWTGGFDVEFNKSRNNYADSLFDSVYSYQYMLTDIWGGYNIGARRKVTSDHDNRLRHFIAIRSFYKQFFSRPLMYKETFNYNYANINGVLFAYNLFRQNFFLTNFIYGFGITEDVPVGLSAVATLGWTNKDGKKRNYYGLSGQASKYTDRGNYYDFNLRFGSFSYRNHFEDLDILLGVDHFTKLRNLSSNWKNRNFLSVAITKQHNHVLNAPLFLQSEFGLPYYRNGDIQGNSRTTIAGESVFFNMQKFLGFRFAPFAFAGSSFITPVGKPFSKTQSFTAFGGGLRTRNENLILGTMEVKGFVFTRKTYPEMKNWRIEFSTNLKFKYNSTFIKRPDFVHSN